MRFFIKTPWERATILEDAIYGVINTLECEDYNANELRIKLESGLEIKNVKKRVRVLYLLYRIARSIQKEHIGADEFVYGGW